MNLVMVRARLQINLVYSSLQLTSLPFCLKACLLPLHIIAWLEWGASNAKVMGSMLIPASNNYPASQRDWCCLLLEKGDNVLQIQSVMCHINNL